jgi:hypothetical protein
MTKIFDLTDNPTPEDVERVWRQAGYDIADPEMATPEQLQQAEDLIDTTGATTVARLTRERESGIAAGTWVESTPFHWQSIYEAAERVMYAQQDRQDVRLNHLPPENMWKSQFWTDRCRAVSEVLKQQRRQILTLLEIKRVSTETEPA